MLKVETVTFYSPASLSAIVDSLTWTSKRFALLEDSLSLALTEVDNLTWIAVDKVDL